jgi:hypothetical protein
MRVRGEKNVDKIGLFQIDEKCYRVKIEGLKKRKMGVRPAFIFRKGGGAKCKGRDLYAQDD